MTYGIALDVARSLRLYQTEDAATWCFDPREARAFATRQEAEAARSNLKERRYTASSVVDLNKEAEAMS